jgi:ribosome maturation factor RimP
MKERMSEAFITQLEQIAQEVTEAEGCLLYDIEFTGSGKGRILRIFIDKESGVGIQECTNVSRAINDRLDVDDIIPGGAYSLEVSSPGLERILRKKWHFAKALGEKVDFRLSKPLGSLGVDEKRWQACKHTDGVLVAADEEVATLEIAGGTHVRIPFDIFEKAKIVFDFSKPRNKR